MAGDDVQNIEDIPRFLDLAKDYSFFLFGPRGSGKTTLIKRCFQNNTLFIDLLDYDQEQQFKSNPNRLLEITKADSSNKLKYIVIDEVQKVPKLLDLVHKLIESTEKIFVLTGSSARKLKRGQANLLAGRAFLYNLHPFSYLEVEHLTNLDEVLSWGLLPKIFSLKTENSKMRFLQTYTKVYLKEEIVAEQVVRKLDPFRNFLEVAAQMNSEPINFSKIASDVGVHSQTVQEYYKILEDTLMGFTLNAFQHSFRKRLISKPKFYFFDIGVQRALTLSLNSKLRQGSYAYGRTFEHLVVLEAIKLASYYKYEYRFSYLKTKSGAEIDLVVERPGEKVLFIEIKSSTNVNEADLANLISLSKDFGDCEAVCLSRDSLKRKVKNLIIYPWQEGLRELFF